MTTYTHEELRELLGVYALDAVDPDEARQVEAHLQTCPQCLAEVNEHREVASALAYSGSDAPPELWDRISAEIGGDPGELPAMPPLGPNVTPLRPSRRRWLAPAAAAAAAVVVAVLGFQVVSQADRIDELQEQAQVSVRDLAQEALSHDDAQTARLTGDDGTEILAVVDTDGTGYLFGGDLDRLSEEWTYQLWGIHDGVAISLGVLGPTPDVVPFTLSGDAEILAVTAEVRGGVISSTQAPVVAGTLS